MQIFERAGVIEIGGALVTWSLAVSLFEDWYDIGLFQRIGEQASF